MNYSVKEIIEYAIKIEKESFAFYTKASQTITDDEVKELLTILAKEEVNHQNRLKGLIDEEKVSVEMLSKKMDVDTTLMEKIVGTSHIAPGSSPLDILTVALEREKNTEQTYAMLSTLSNIDGDIIDIFGELRLQEKGHVNKIQARIKKIS